MPQKLYSPSESAVRTARLVSEMMTFWKEAHGWAPVEAAALLNKSMLEWQKSLAGCLPKWTGPLSDGELILAWTNVGALVEGQLKLFLSVFYEDYAKNLDAAIKDKNGRLKDLDGLSLEPLRVFFDKHIWQPNEKWDEWISLVQHRRNAIHAFKAKTLGDSVELHQTLQTLLLFVRWINSCLPYPDDICEPREA
jgi:hypothetical protein